MHCLGIMLIGLAAIGVWIGVIRLLDDMDIIDIDPPEYPYSDYRKGDGTDGKGWDEDNNDEL